MASGLSARALKAAAVAAVLAVLVLPAMGRCPSLGPQPPAPAPAPPAPAPVPVPSPSPAPAISCGDCPSFCNASCTASPPSCRDFCDRSGCDRCVSGVRQHCTACCNDGTCDCDCDGAVVSACHVTCSPRRCDTCQRYSVQYCIDGCKSYCADHCV